MNTEAEPLPPETTPATDPVLAHLATAIEAVATAKNEAAAEAVMAEAVKTVEDAVETMLGLPPAKAKKAKAKKPKSAAKTVKVKAKKAKVAKAPKKLKAPKAKAEKKAKKRGTSVIAGEKGLIPFKSSRKKGMCAVPDCGTALKTGVRGHPRATCKKKACEAAYRKEYWRLYSEARTKLLGMLG